MIDNHQDILDSRDIIERIHELENALETEPMDDDKVELAELNALADQAKGYSEDWCYGTQLIRDTYFTEYAIEFADAIEAIPNDTRWPMTCIDWDQAASDLQMDYAAVYFDGVTYWVH